MYVNFRLLHCMILMQSEAAIIFRIWRNTLSRSFCRFAIRVVAESGLLYTLTKIVTFSTTVGESPEFSNAYTIASNIVCHQ